MTNNQTLTLRARIIIVVAVLAVTGVITIGLLIGLRQLKADYAEQARLTAALPESITGVFDTKHQGLLPVLTKIPVEKVPFNSYLFFTQHTTDTDDGRVFTHAYSKSINKKLGTDVYYGREDIDGIVFETLGWEVVGYYEEFYKRASPSQALKPYRVLYYMTLPELIVIRQDTLWGGEPPSSIKATESVGTGKHVKDKEVIAAIKEAVR